MSVILFCDIDGTLVNGHYMSERILPKLKEFTDRGNYFSLATGRNAFAMKWLCDKLPVNADCILLAGAALYSPSAGKLKRIKAMPVYAMERVKQVFDTYPDMSIQVFTDAGLTALRLSDFLKTHGIPEERALGERPYEELEGKSILKIGLFNDDVSKIAEAVDRFFPEKDQFAWHMSFVTGAEVYSPAASKGISIEEILSGFDKKPDVVAVAGDSPNDLPMFSYADVKFVPEDGFQELKDKADFVIPTAEEGGIADALDILIKKYC